MRKTKRDGSFILCFLINLVINIEWAIPAIVLLILHFVLDISLWWFVAALAFWIVPILLQMLLLGWLSGLTTSGKSPENKNPYSVKNKD